jgi:muconolactone delta-isomerase
MYHSISKDKLMKILALEKDVPGVTAEQFHPHLKAEAARVWELYQRGVLREIYFRQDRHAAVLVLECETVEDAGRILATMPLVAHGLIEFDVIPLAPYPGFARLFAEEK